MSDEIVNLSTADLADLAIIQADKRYFYGDKPVQFVDFYRPPAGKKWPVLILVHGGCWRAQYSLDHISLLARAIADRGIAVCSLEFHRLGHDAGGWPGTFLDVAAGADLVRVIAAEEPLDLANVVAMGHSAGGHLVLWLSGRHQIDGSSPLFHPDPIKLQGVISLAGVADLARAGHYTICGDAPERLAGGDVTTVPENYAAGSPAQLLPLGIRQVLISGGRDEIVPPAYVEEYAVLAQAAGDEVNHIVVETSAHFELIVPDSLAWPTVWAEVEKACLRG